MVSSNPTTLPYADVLTRFAPDVPVLPVFRVHLPRTLEAYFPAWTPAAMLDEHCQRLGTKWPQYDLLVWLVTDVPAEQVRGIWREYMPGEEGL